MATETAGRWRPQAAILPALRYLQRPVQLVRGYDRANLQTDLLAGLTVGVVLLPQAIAFSLLANLPPQMGLYTAVVGGIAAALWGSSEQLHSGPTNTISLLVFSTLAVSFTAGSDQYILAAGLLALMAGLLQLGLGLLRLGFIVNFVSHSVIVGFSTAAGVLILVRQIDPLLGLSLPNANALSGFVNSVLAVPKTHLFTAMIGLGSIALILLLRRLNPRLPGALIALLVATAVVALLGDRADGVAVIGAIGGGLPRPVSLPVLNLRLISDLSTGALAVAAIGLVQTTAVSRSLASQTHQRLDNNQEFVGQGMANVLSGLFGGYSTSGSFTISAVKFRAGARTRLASVVASLFVLLVMLVAGPVGKYMPVSAIAAALIVTAYNMLDRSEIRRILRGAPGDAIIMVVTFLGTLFLNLDFAVLVRILLSFVLYVMRTSAPRVQVVVPDADFRHFLYQPDAPVCPQLGTVEIQGDLYFGAVNHIEEAILQNAAEQPEQRFLIIRMHHVNQIDFSGIHMLESLVQTYRQRGGDLFLVRVAPQALHLMQTTGCLDYLGEGNILEEDDAIQYVFRHVLDPAVCIYECPVRVFRECQNLPKRFDLIAPPLFDHPVMPSPPTVAPRDLWQTLRTTPADRQPTVLDVREPREFRRSHIAEAQSTPLSMLLAGGLALSADRPVVLVCRTGRRSRRAAAVLRDLGHHDLTVLAGGMQAWEAAGLLTAVELT